jgi:hypothetical protein
MNQGRSATRAQSAGERLRRAVLRPGGYARMTAETTPLTGHPSDPAIARS